MRRAVAEYILGVRFSDADNARIHFLADRCQLGTLTPLEKSEYQELVEAGMLLSV
jgi:1,2-phenylacetyl-CoA epoxidase catalytic subunit